MLTIETVSLTPTNAVTNAVWDNESGALSNDGSWAVLPTRSSTALKLNTLTTGFADPGEWHCIGLKVNVYSWICDTAGNPWVQTDTDPCRLRIQVSKDGGVPSPESGLVECRIAGLETVGSEDTIFGLDGITFEELTDADFTVHISCPIDLGDESLYDVVRSVNYVTLTAYLVNRTEIDLTLISATGSCSGNVAVEFEG